MRTTITTSLVLTILACLAPAASAAQVEPTAATRLKPSLTGSDGIPLVAPGTAIPALRHAAQVYQPGVMPFISDPREKTISLHLTGGTVAQCQAQIDTARAPDDTAILVIELSGSIEVADTPLRFPSRTCVVARHGAKVVATSGSAAQCLLDLTAVEMVGIAPGDGGELTLDGGQRVAVGLRIRDGGRIHLDGLHVSNCVKAGLAIAGRGADTYADPVSLVRSTITGNAGDGITVRDSAQFIALDNRIVLNRATGLDVDSASTILGNNICAGNGTGIRIAAKDGTIDGNQVIANGVGLCLDQGSDYTLVRHNAIQDNRLGLQVLGQRATVGWNRLHNRQQVQTAGSGNVLLCNSGLSAADVGTGASYFNPPTAANPHREAIIWKGEKVGSPAMERFDVTIASGELPMDDIQLGEQLAAARAAHPDQVVVATLKGTFEIRSDEGLAIPDRTCVLLDGTIRNDRSEAHDVLVRAKGSDCISLSGGVLVSRGKVKDAINGMEASNTLLIDGMHFDLSSPNGKEGAISTNTLSAKKHKGVFAVNRCDFRNPGQRAVWAHVTARAYILDSTFQGGGLTIDFDAFCSHSAAIGNDLSGNSYHSTIFLEEAVSANTVYANCCHDNMADGIVVFNAEVKGVTRNNLIACNELSDNSSNGRSDLGFGGRTAAYRCEDNYAFNNRILRNRGRGAVTLKAFATNNYLAQTVVRDCPKVLCNLAQKPVGDSYGGNAGFTGPLR